MLKFIFESVPNVNLELERAILKCYLLFAIRDRKIKAFKNNDRFNLSVYMPFLYYRIALITSPWG